VLVFGPVEELSQQIVLDFVPLDLMVCSFVSMVASVEHRIGLVF
jgi:hypothetical protein